MLGSSHLKYLESKKSTFFKSAFLLQGDLSLGTLNSRDTKFGRGKMFIQSLYLLPLLKGQLYSGERDTFSGCPVHIYDFHIFFSCIHTSASSFHGFVTNQFDDLLPVGLLLAERCTGIAEVKGSNPVQA